jgi:hypothetical protein
MKNILFFIHNEYHVFVIISLIKEYYSDLSKYNVTVLHQINPNDNRFEFEIKWEELGVEVITIKASKLEINKGEIVPKLELILQKDYYKYISFLEGSPINWYLAEKLKYNGTIISVAPEGTKPYITISKAALYSRFRATFENYQYLRKNTLPLNSLNLISNKNGSLKQTDEVLINHPEFYQNRTHKKVVPVRIHEEKSHLQLASKMFGFNILDHFKQVDGILLYLNHWVVEFKIYDLEIEILQRLKILYPEKEIYIKLHPNTHKFQLERLKKIEGISLFYSTIPAEIFIGNIKNSIVFSFWSASLLINNPTCKFYWLYSMIAKNNIKMKWFSIVNPTQHINSVEEIKNITF